MNLNNYYNQITKEVLQHPSVTASLKDAILSLHESATKLWIAEEKQPDKLNTRAANALISVFYVMKEMGIEDPEKILQTRLEELKKENN